MVAPQERRLPSAEGKAEMPGAGEVMSCMSSVWSLGEVSSWLLFGEVRWSSSEPSGVIVPLGGAHRVLWFGGCGGFGVLR